MASREYQLQGCLPPFLKERRSEKNEKKNLYFKVSKIYIYHFIPSYPIGNGYKKITFNSKMN